MSVMLTPSLTVLCALVLAGCASPADTGTGDPVAATSSSTPPASASPTTNADPVPCAEFPVATGTGPDYEGWWSSSPADAEANILENPDDWPPMMRDHPQTALVSTNTHRVVSTWDRLACGPIPGYVSPEGTDWPPDSVVVLDATTGEVVHSFHPTTSPDPQAPVFPTSLSRSPP